MIRKIYILTPSHLPYFITVTETITPMFIRHSTPSNSKWDKKRNKKKHPPRIITGHIKNLNIQLFAGINKWIYSVSYLERHLNINKQTSSVRQKHYQWRTHFFFFWKALYIHVASYLRKGIFPSQPCWKANLFKKCSDREPARLRLYGLMYIVCSEQKNASQKPSVVVYNIGCQKGFI